MPSISPSSSAPHAAPGTGDAAAPGGRAALVASFFRTATLQIEDIERRIAAAPRTPAECERDARVTAALAKVLRDLSNHDAEQAGPDHDDSDDDRGPRDIDEFRLALVRKMDAIIARREARHRDGTAGGLDRPVGDGLDAVRPSASAPA
jgi:hypothetical protein